MPYFLDFTGSTNCDYADFGTMPVRAFSFSATNGIDLTGTYNGAFTIEVNNDSNGTDARPEFKIVNDDITASISLPSTGFTESSFWRRNSMSFYSEGYFDFSAVQTTNAYRFFTNTSTQNAQIDATGFTAWGSGTEVVVARRATNTVGHQIGMAFTLNDATNSSTQYAAVYGEIVDNTNGSEDGSFVIKTMRAGTLTEDVRIVGGRVGVGGTPTFASLDTFSDGATLAALAIRDTRGRTIDVGPQISFVGKTSGDSPTELGFIQVARENTSTNAAAYMKFVVRDGSSVSGVELERMRISSDGALQKPEQSTTPAVPLGGSAVNIYMRGNKIIFQFDDGGTTRYKYLDLTGTGVTWTHSTVEPT